MAKVHGLPGEWARVKGTVLGLWPLFICIFAAGAAVALLFFSMILGMVALLAALIGTIWSLLAGLRHVESYFKGARGEEKVSGILSSLPDTYHVFNDFRAGNCRVDHVVVGPSGVYSIETKFWRGKVTIEEGHVLVDGRLPSRSPLSQTIGEAVRVKSALAALGWQGLVTPVLAFASDTFDAHRAEIRGTVIMNSSELRRSFETERVTIPPQELDRLVSMMESIL